MVEYDEYSFYADVKKRRRTKHKSKDKEEVSRIRILPGKGRDMPPWRLQGEVATSSLAQHKLSFSRPLLLLQSGQGWFSFAWKQ